jgi:molybdopterin-guanine dinucleotide biosynthesis protein A
MPYDQGADPPVGFLWPAGHASLVKPIAAGADAVQGQCPLGDFRTALRLCDNPRWTPELLESLLEAAERAGKDRRVPSDGGGLERLRAVYHCRVLPADACAWPVPDAEPLKNVNTPQDWVRAWDAERKNS